MIKLLLCLLATMATAICLMQLRQQRLELNHETSQLHNAIESRQARLWNQQLKIADLTTPPAVKTAVKKQDLRLTPLAPVGIAPSTWIDTAARYAVRPVSPVLASSAAKER